MFGFFRKNTLPPPSSYEIEKEVVGSRKVTHAIRESYEIRLQPGDSISENTKILQRYAKEIGYETTPILTRKDEDTIVLYFNASSSVTGLNYNSSIYKNIKWND